MKKLLILLSVLLVACQNVPASEDGLAPTVADVLEAQVIVPTVGYQFPFKKPRPASFVRANEDTRTPLQWAQAACQSATWSPDDPQKGWRCGNKVPRPMLAASGGAGPIIPTTWTVPNWFVNKSTGNDANTCTASGSPCATKGEIVVHRLGCQGMPNGCPRFQQTTVIEQDASDTDNTDPLYLRFTCEKGANCLTLQGATPTAVTTTTLGAATAARNRAAGTNALLLAQFSAGAPSVGQMVQNTTNSSYAFVYSANGGNWNMTNPAAPITPPSIAYTEVNSWASTNAVKLLSMTAINVVDFEAITADYNASFDSIGILYHMTIFDPSGATNDPVRLSRVQAVESTTQRTIAVAGPPDFNGTNLQLWNFFNNGGMNATEGSVETFGGAITSGAVAANGQIYTSANTYLDGDYISGGAITNRGFLLLGSVYLDSTAISSGYIEMKTDPFGIGLGTAVLWGSGSNTINMLGSAHFAQLTGNSFASSFTAPGLVTGIQLNGTATGNSDCALTFHAGISTTPAHLDAACGAAGFGSNGFNFGGASVANF